MDAEALLESHWPGHAPRRGKVRDCYALGAGLLLVATDRISAFDVVMANGVPGKGRILTALSRFWFDFFAGEVRHHLLPGLPPDLPPDVATQFAGRTLWCRKAEVVPIECVVRGYLAGSGWREYQRDGRVCGVALPAGLRLSDRLTEPIFTPATKAEQGHDENISFEQAAERVGGETMRTLRELSLRLYRRAAEHARARGLVLADTKFEFGRAATGPDRGELMLIDEVLTPDSSRFWPADGVVPGREPESFDKQFVRSYLERLCAAGRWDKRPPGPELPPEVIRGTQARYVEALRRLTSD
ncbi:MAG: phosphoribosylaminoimidazolesuccinocarboxamide synthase [Phycisphaerae bacterium]